jgi:hypothetical protein
MPSFVFDDKGLTQREKREVLRNDQRVRKATYHSFAQASADDLAGGRFAGVQPTTVTGSTPGSAFPRIDSGPWAKNECPPEALIDGRGEGNVTGYEIDKGPGSTPAADDSHVITEQTGVDAGGDGHGSGEVLMPAVTRSGFLRRF